MDTINVYTSSTVEYLGRPSSSKRRNCFTSRCARLAKEQRARLYILRRCATMLLCCHRSNLGQYHALRIPVGQKKEQVLKVRRCHLPVKAVGQRLEALSIRVYIWSLKFGFPAPQMVVPEPITPPLYIPL